VVEEQMEERVLSSESVYNFQFLPRKLEAKLSGQMAAPEKNLGSESSKTAAYRHGQRLTSRRWQRRSRLRSGCYIMN
jgi:hypothetical protein